MWHQPLLCKIYPVVTNTVIGTDIKAIIRISCSRCKRFPSCGEELTECHNADVSGPEFAGTVFINMFFNNLRYENILFS